MQGEVAALIRAFDWGATALGPIAGWPQSLRTAVGILLHSPVPIVMLWGADGHMIYNDAYSVFAGGRHPTLLGSKVLEGWPEVADFNAHVMKVGLAGGTLAYRDQELTLHRHGSPERVWMNLDYSPVIDERGEPAGVIAIVLETTERVLGEAALREANETLEAQVALRTAELQEKEARLRAIFETSFSFQGLLTPDGILIDANTTSLDAVAASRDALIGMPFADTPWFAGTEGMSALVRDAVAAVAAGEVLRQELLLNLPVGGWRWFDLVMRPIRDAAGTVIAICPEAVETTERRVAEDALRQAQKLDAMGQLTGGVAHDFNNLLTPIIGSLDLLHRRRLGNEREQRLIEGGLQSAERAKTLVQRLLAFARRQPLQPEAVDVAALIAAMRDLIASTSGPRIRLEVAIDDALPAATAEGSQLEMALLNLAVNARDAMPDGGTLTITAGTEVVAPGQRELAPGRYVRITVSDTGIGMDDHTMRHAIEPFFSTKGIGKGTGLGLSMVHGLSSQLGGGLTIASKPGLGTTIELLLPVSPVPAAPDDAGMPADPLYRAAGTALLVDDEAVVRAATADMLVELGYQVVEASSAEEALAALDARDYDLLVTDHLMSGMTGAALVRYLRARKPDLPSLVISGYADAAGIAPDVPRLAKPFKSGDLAAVLQGLGAKSSRH